jgi:6-phosphofructokinase 1
MNFALLTSGGDCAGMNPAIKYFVERCFAAGHCPWGVEDGFEGLIDGAIQPLGYEDVGGIINRGGSVLRCSRSERFREPSGRATAAKNLEEHGIDGLVVLGGDGSFHAIRALNEEAGTSCAGIPATIDNDVPGSGYSIGVDTALNVILRSIDEIRDTASSFRRAFVVETMGHSCGYLALVSALVSGAEVCIIPEIRHDLDSIGRRLRNDFESGRRYAIAVVSEGVEGASAEMLDWFHQELSVDSRLTTLGHTQRGGSPTVHDRLMAVAFVSEAIEGLEAGEDAFAVLHQRGGLGRQPLADLPTEASINPRLLDLVQRLCR